MAKQRYRVWVSAQGTSRFAAYFLSKREALAYVASLLGRSQPSYVISVQSEAL